MMLQDRFDKIIFLLGILLFIAGVYFINFFEMRPAGDLGNLIPIAQVVKIEKSSKRKLVGSLNWDNVSKNADLYQGDLVLTGASEGLEISYKNNLNIKIGENSLVKIDLRDNIFDLEVIKGTLDVDMSDAGGKVSVRSGDDIKILEGKSAQVNISSIGGSLETLVKKGNISAQDKGKTPVKPQVKSPLYSLNENRFNPLKDSVVKVNNLAKSDIALQLSKDRSFAASSTINISSNGGSIPLPAPGNYFLKDKNGAIKNFIVDEFTPPVIKNVKPLYLVAPGEMIPFKIDSVETVDYKIVVGGAFDKEMTIKGSSLQLPALAKGQVELSVAPLKNLSAVQKVSFEINFVSPIELDSVRVSHQLERGEYRHATVTIIGKSKEGDFRKEIGIEDDKGKLVLPNRVNRTTAQFLNVKLGDYKVVAKTTNARVPLKNFTIQRKISTDLVNYRKNQIAPSAKAITGQLLWTKFSGVKYRVRVAKDPQFKQILVNQELEQSQYAFKAPSTGQYYWKVEALGNDSILPSKTQILNITYPELIKLTSAQKIILKNTRNKGVTCYEFELPRMERVRTYELEVYSDKNLSNLVFERKMAQNKGCWYSNKTGRFYYRYRVKDMWSRLSNYSPRGEMIFPISPLTEF